jgi:TP901 family phage tail tape measure protein
MAEREARVVVKAIDQTTETVRRINQQIDGMVAPIRRVASELRTLREAVNANAVVQGLESIGKSARQVGRQMSTYVTAPILGAGALITRTAVDFEQGMNNIAAVSRAPADELARMRDLAKELGRTTQFSASEAAAGMEFLARAGWETNQILAGTPGLLNLAAATGSDLGFSADVASNIMGSFGMAAEETNRVADVLAATTASANVDLRMLAEGFSKAGKVADDFGMSFEETAAALGLLGNIGIQGGEGGTALRNSMLQLVSPSSEASKMLAGMGVETKDAAGNMRAYADIMTDFGQRLEFLGSGEQLEAMAALFGVRTVTGASELIKQARNGELQEYASQLNDVTGRSKEMADIMNEGLPGAIRSMKSAFEGLQLQIAESGMIDDITTLVTRLTEFLRNLTETNPKTIRFVTILAAVAAAIGPVLMGFGLMASGLAAVAKAILFSFGALKVLAGFLIANPIFAAIAAIGFAVYAIYDNWDNIVEWFTDKINRVVAAFDNGFLAGIMAIFEEFNIIDLVADAFYGLIDWIFGIDSRAAVQGFIDNMVANLNSAWEGVMAWAAGAVNGLLDWIMSFDTVRAGLAFIGGLWDGFEAGWDSLVAWFHEAMQGVWDWLNGFSLFNAGVAIIQSLWDGLKERWSKLTGWLSEQINGLVEWMPDWVKDRLGLGGVNGAMPGENSSNMTPAPAIIPDLSLPSASMALPAIPTPQREPSLAVQAQEHRAAVRGEGQGAPRIDAPVTVTMTVNGLADVEVVRRETEAAVRRAMDDWERRQRSASAAALYD